MQNKKKQKSKKYLASLKILYYICIRYDYLILNISWMMMRNTIQYNTIDVTI
jgi:hypothetical protein